MLSLILDYDRSQLPLYDKLSSGFRLTARDFQECAAEFDFVETSDRDVQAAFGSLARFFAVGVVLDLVDLQTCGREILIAKILADLITDHILEKPSEYPERFPMIDASRIYPAHLPIHTALSKGESLSTPTIDGAIAEVRTMAPEDAIRARDSLYLLFALACARGLVPAPIACARAVLALEELTWPKRSDL